MTRDPLRVWQEVVGGCGAALPNERLLLIPGDLLPIELDLTS